MTAAAVALELGLQVWLSPEMFEQSRETTLAYLTFADPWLTHSADPRYDLDMTATSLVKTYARGHGSTYPDMPWEPKQAFGAVASFYVAR